MNDVESRAPMKWMVIGFFVGIALLSSFVVACTDPNAPKPKITAANGYESFQDLNRLYKVDVTVKNNGADGWNKVYVRIIVAGKYERQDQRIYLANGENKSLQFVFDISFWGATTSPFVSYRAWAEAD